MKETEFVLKNQQMILDLIRAVYLHENLRGQHGPGLGALMDSRYVTAHSIMSKLSRELGSELHFQDLEAMAERYKDLPEHIAFNTLIGISC